MAEKKFNVGDRVQLKSGGPIMTVYCYNDDSELTCSWFDAKEYKAASFEQDMLDKVD